MPQTSFEQEICIAASSEEVKRFLITLKNLSQVHPLIVAIQHTATTTAQDGSEVNYYKIRDRMKQGPFTLSFSYNVAMWINAQGEIISDAHQSPGIYLHNVTRCLPEGAGTRVRERVEITAPYLLIKTVYKQGLAAHQQMFNNLKNVLEKQTARG